MSLPETLYSDLKKAGSSGIKTAIGVFFITYFIAIAVAVVIVYEDFGSPLWFACLFALAEGIMIADLIFGRFRRAWKMGIPVIVLFVIAKYIS